MKKIILISITLLLVSCTSVVDETRVVDEECGFVFKEKISQSGTDIWVDTQLNQNYILNAESKLDRYFSPYVEIEFNEEGTKLLAEITEKNIGNRLGIFINGEFINSPYVNDKITGGIVSIVGKFTQDDANELVDCLPSIIE